MAQEYKDFWTFNKWVQSRTANKPHTYTLAMSGDITSEWDCVMLKYLPTAMKDTLTTSFFELKGRNVSITQFPDMVVDESKIDRLQEISKCSPTFVVGIYYENKQLAIWSVTPDTNFTVTEMWCNQSTIDPLQKKVKKKMCHLPLTLANVYHFD